MILTTDANGRYEVNCETSEALSSLVIYPGIHTDSVLAVFRGNPDTLYVYGTPKGEALPNLVALDSAGKFVATWAKKVAHTAYKLEVLK